MPLRLGQEVQEVPRSRAVGTSALALLFVLPGHPARAQSETAARAVSFDSAAVLERARAAQREFETLRRGSLPLDRGDGRGPCDVKIGRFCYWYAPTTEEPLPEPPRIDDARAVLLDALADAARLSPREPWIAGQRVRYLVEHGRPNAALAAARECLADAWWCTALEGFALHAADGDAHADVAFAKALELMPAEERCRWTDLSVVLGDEAGPYTKLPCDAREARNTRIWWLARPLYTRPGNDLRVEHYARRVMVRMLQDAETPHTSPWGPDLAEMIVRYGWPVHWTRPSGRPTDERPAALGHERSPSWWFFASNDVPPAWDLGRERPWARYAPPWAAEFSTIHEAQIARFRRGDSSVTVAGFDLSTDTALAGQLPRVALAVGSDAASPVFVSPPVTAAHGAVAVQSPDPPAIVSLEAVHDASRWAARFRTATADPTAWLTSPLSDILLVQAEAASSGAVNPLTAVALTGPLLPVGRPVGIYWEWYQRPAAGSVLAIEARVARLGGKGFPDPLGHSDCGPAGKAAIAVQWREQVAERPAGVGRVVALDLTRLEPGRYLIAISVGVEGAPDPPRCTSREIQLAGR